MKKYHRKTPEVETTSAFQKKHRVCPNSSRWKRLGSFVQVATVHGTSGTRNQPYCHNGKCAKWLASWKRNGKEKRLKSWKVKFLWYRVSQFSPSCQQFFCIATIECHGHRHQPQYLRSLGSSWWRSGVYLWLQKHGYSPSRFLVGYFNGPTN